MTLSVWSSTKPNSASREILCMRHGKSALRQSRSVAALWVVLQRDYAISLLVGLGAPSGSTVALGPSSKRQFNTREREHRFLSFRRIDGRHRFEEYDG